ncbi:phage portal protein [Corallococcus sp. ZKHCc1 1396]|uniref:Phage portal protein n=1 Tax=Corallococcus soli TaxID=2710757 RepID=A0ABR9PIT5_9BACT|nr:phage portal protein [Corallococcus soli]MBE4747759.1 phage portal protein [Corallococcus soli]
MASLFRRTLKALGFLPTRRGPLVNGLPLFSFSPRRGSREVLAAYRENGWLRAVVDTVADAVATPRWKVYKRVGSSYGKSGADPRWRSPLSGERKKALADGVRAGALVELPAHELLSLLEAPHPQFPGRELLKLMQLHLDLVGETFLWLRLGADGRPVGWEVVPPHCVHQTPQPGRPEFVLSYNQAHVGVPAAHMLWLKHLDPENPHGRGAGRGLAVGDQLDTMEAIDRSAKAVFERGGVPQAIVGMDSKKDDVDQEDAAEDLEKRYNEVHRGPENAGKIWFAPAGVSLAQVTVNYRELQAEELAKGQRAYVRQTYNVPPELVGDLSSSSRGTSEAAKYHLAEYAVSPRLEFLRAYLQLVLVPLVDRDAILDYEDPRPQEWERVFRLMTTPVTEAFTFNEVRVLAGFEPDPELEGKRPLPLPGAGGGNNVASAAANATPNPPRDRRGEEGRV